MFSVVIPLYNKRDCIQKTIGCVLAQTFGDYEIIVVDDGSTDGSLEIVKAIADEKVKVFTQPNKGVSAARNTGISHASGEIIAFLDADDIWDSSYLQKQYDLISKYPDAVVYGIGYDTIQNGTKANIGKTAPFEGYVRSDWVFPFFYWTSATTCRTNAIKEIGGFDERMTYGEDCDVWYRLLLNGKGVLSSEILAYYNKDAKSSLTGSPMPLEKHIPFFIDKYQESRASNQDFRQFFDMQMIYRLYPYLFDKKYKSMARELAQKLDYSILKPSMKFRMLHPHFYQLIRKIKG